MKYDRAESPEINLIGMTVEEAREELEKYIDRASAKRIAPNICYPWKRYRQTATGDSVHFFKDNPAVDLNSHRRLE